MDPLLYLEGSSVLGRILCTLMDSLYLEGSPVLGRILCA